MNIVAAITGDSAVIKAVLNPAAKPPGRHGAYTKCEENTLAALAAPHTILAGRIQHGVPVRRAGAELHGQHREG